MAERVQRFHEFRQQVIVRAAQLNRHSCPQFRHQVFARDQLVIGRNARRHEGVEIGALQAACMAADQLFRGKPGLHDAAHARIALDDAAHVHDFRDTADLWPRQDIGENGSVEIRPAALQPRCGRHAGGREQNGAQGQVLDGFRRPAHPFHTMHIAEFMGVPDDGRDAAGNHGRRISGRRDHRAFDMHMCVDEAGRDIGACRIDDPCSVAAACPLVHAGDQSADNADIGGAKLSRHHIHQCSAADENIERCIAACGGDRAAAQRIIGEIGRLACRKVRAHRAASRRNASRIAVFAPSAPTVSAKCALKA